MKKLLILFSIIFLTSCDPVGDPPSDQKLLHRSSNGVEYRIVTIDSCEYIYWEGGYAWGVTHKGNCQYCAERNKIISE